MHIFNQKIDLNGKQRALDVMGKLHPSYKPARNRRRFGAMTVPGYETD